MRKLGFFLFGLVFSFAFILSVNNKFVAVAEEKKQSYVYVGGMPAGFTLQSGNVQIVGICEVMTENGVFSPAHDAGLQTGMQICAVNNVKIETISKLNELVDASNGKTVTLQIKKGGETQNVSVKPVKDKLNNRYKIGILARDSVSGIGTITYIDKNYNRFAALGHSVFGENKQEMKISSGTVYGCNVVSVQKGVRGKAGELRGMFLGDKTVGKAEKLCDCGIFGALSIDFSTENLIKAYPDSSMAMPGKAYIYSTVNGEIPKRFEIEIVKIDKNNRENKNYVVKITDDDLISQTGGIVQGMSGSPIMQNDKLIGAITHVFLNDPTRGYGIDIQTMIGK